MDIIANLDQIEANVIRACKEAGCRFEDIEIVAATKCQTSETLAELAKDGRIKIFGENRVQELLEKYREEYTFDIIGQLQTNKVKYIIDKVRLIQSVDRDSLAKEINRLAEKHGKIQKILVEVNSGNEVQKGGVSPDSVEEFVDSLKIYPNIAVVGLMAVAPLGIDERELGKLFTNVYRTYEKLKRENSEIRYLSMGMSHDYELAIRCGANLIRPGRALFGERY